MPVLSDPARPVHTPAPPVRRGGLVRFSLLLSAGVWTFAMLVIGLLLLFEWPARFGPIVKNAVWVSPVLGATLFASGEYVLAMLLRELFPKAAPILFRAAAWAPWLSLLLLGPFGVMLWTTPSQ